MDSNNIIYKINNILCASPTSDIDEIVQNLPIHETPLSKEWLTGVIHLRGKIIPITHLNLFISEHAQGTRAYTPKRNEVILIVTEETWSYGIQIAQIVGVSATNTFDEVNHTPPTSEHIPEILKRISKGTMKKAGEEYLTIDLKELIKLPEFINSCRV